MTNTEKALAVLASLETGDEAAGKTSIDDAVYIQHNLGAPDGKAAFMALVPMSKQAGNTVKVIRTFADGDYVFTHTSYNFFGPKVGFDIFRFKGGKIVEHWDNLQETAARNPSGRSQVDGPAQASDAGSTAANKALVKRLYDEVFIGGHWDRLPAWFDGDAYVQHNPMVADGLSSLLQAADAMAKSGKPMRFASVHMILGEGNFVLVVSEGTFLGAHSSFYDLYFVEKGKIAEHWDTIEQIPPRGDWKNANGKF
jgi:predicted SnoaL-like aldol condensation-catalyzing enzyme